MDVERYLDRIGYQGPKSPTIDTLRGMHRAHFLNVPFENLDVARGVRIEVDPTVNYVKVVEKRRGGWCLELTGLFATALREVGFRVDVLAGGPRSAFVTDSGLPVRPKTHMTLIVHLDEDWIADVGYGGRIAEPLRLNEREPQLVGERRYVVANHGDQWVVTSDEAGTPTGEYLFTIEPRALADFQGACDWLQTSPDSLFTKGDVVSLATPTGRATLAGGRLTTDFAGSPNPQPARGRRLITIEGGTREEREVSTEEDERTILDERFGIRLS